MSVLYGMFHFCVYSKNSQICEFQFNEKLIRYAHSYPMGTQSTHACSSDLPQLDNSGISQAFPNILTLNAPLSQYMGQISNQVKLAEDEEQLKCNQNIHLDEPC